MSRVSLISEARVIQRHDPIEDADLLRACAAFSKAPSDLELEGLGKLCLYQSKFLSLPNAVKSSPCTTTDMSLVA